MADKMVRTTITLPWDLKEAADKAIREGKAQSRNELIVDSLRHELALLQRVSLDADLPVWQKTPPISPRSGR